MTTKRLLSFVMAICMVMSLLVFPAYATTEATLNGDLNGDGFVTTDDVVQLLLFISMPDMFPLEGHKDFDGSGDIGTDDAVKLLLHISMPDMFPLETAPTEPVVETLVLGDNAVALEAGSETGKTWTYTAEFTGKLELTVSSLKYAFDGSGEFYEASQMDLEMGFGRMYAFNINGENVGVYTTSLDVTEGDVISVGLLSYSGFATEAVITLAQGVAGGDSEEIVSTQDIVLAAGDVDGETISYVAQSTGKLNIAVTALAYDWDGTGVFTDVPEMDLEMGFGRMCCLTVDGVQYYQSSVTIDVYQYQLVEINLLSTSGYATNATITFTETAGSGSEPTDPSVPGGDEGTQDNPIVIEALPYSIEFFGGMDKYYVYTTTEAGVITVTALENGILSLPNGEAWDFDDAGNYAIPVEAGYTLVLNPWTMAPEISGEMVVSFAAGGTTEPTDPTEPSVDPTEPGAETSGSINIESYGNADWTAPQDGYVKFTINIEGATLAILNGYTPLAEGASPVTVQVTAGTTYGVYPQFVDVACVVTWEYVEGGDVGGGDVESIPSGGALALGDNNVTLTYANMPMMAPYWTYTATENGYLTVTVASINGETNLGMAFGRGMYTLLVGETDGAFTNTASVYMTAGQSVNVAVLDTLDMTEVPAVLNLTFAAGEPVVEKDPADYFEKDENGYYVIGSLESPVDIFVGNDDISYVYTAEAAGTLTLTATVDEMTATNGWLKVNDGAWDYYPSSTTVAEGDVVVINIWNGYEGTVSFEAAPVEPTEPSETEPTTPDVGYVTTPVVGQAYKFMLTQANLGKDLYITGAMSGYYYATTESADEAVTVYFEEAEGGYRVYFLNDGVKTYMEMVKNGNYNNVVFTTAPTKVLKWNAEIASVTCDLDGTEFYFGTYNTFNTFSASKISYVTGDNAATMDVTNFVGHFYVTEEAPVEPTEPSTEPTEPSTEPTEPSETEPSESEPVVEAGYVKITSADQLVSGQYVMIVGTGYAPGVLDGTWLSAVQPVVEGDKVTDTQGAVWTLTVGADGVSIQDANGVFVAPKGGNNNGIKNAEYFWAVSCENGTFRFAGTGSDTVILASNADAQYGNKFRGYKTTTISGNPDTYPCDFTLYALVGEDTPVEPTEPSTEPTEPSETEPVVLPETPAEIVYAAYTLAPGETLEGTYTLTGVISAINTPYSEQYGNVSVSIVVEGMEDFPIQCYRLKGTGADQIGKGDTITVTGSLTNYNGNIQFAQGCTLDTWEDTGVEEVLPVTPEEIVNAAYALATGEAMSGTYTLTGVITKIDTPYSEQYGNVTVTIVVGDMTDKPIMCYRLKGEGADQIAVGDTITVTGAIKNYYGTVEFDSGCTLDAWTAGAEESVLTWQEYVKMTGAEQRAYKESFENSADYYAWLADAQAKYDAEHESVMDGVINMGDLVNKG